MDDPVTPCRFKQYAERRVGILQQERDGIILDHNLSFVPQPNDGYVIFSGRVRCRKDVMLDVGEYLTIRGFHPHQSWKDGVVSLTAYKYHIFRNGGPNICRFDSPHTLDHPAVYPDAEPEDHDHHDYQHLHLFDPDLDGGQEIRRIWSGDTPLLSDLLREVHDWRFGTTSTIQEYEMRIWPFEDERATPK